MFALLKKTRCLLSVVALFILALLKKNVLPIVRVEAEALVDSGISPYITVIQGNLVLIRFMPMLSFYIP